ncbi:hypothetical protein [Streptomyces sp. NPDC014777]|uniref:hypothetical protein n=1 Tax=Streptomyces sp. NPDC014777 TaxID=3364910 RepID=UPI0036F892B8
MSATGQPLDADTAKCLIAEALDVTGLLPSRERLAELDALLRAEMVRVISALKADECLVEPVGAAIAQAESVLAYPVPIGRLMTAIHVRSLAKALCVLRRAVDAAR